MDSQLSSDIALNTYFCPNCCAGSFRDHSMDEYSRKWNKCSSCSYMELKTITKARILSALDPSQLTEPFIDPLSKITDNISNVETNTSKIKKNKNCCESCECSCNK